MESRTIPRVRRGEKEPLGGSVMADNRVYPFLLAWQITKLIKPNLELCSLKSCATTSSISQLYIFIE
jgi:hypothetical protein